MSAVPRHGENRCTSVTKGFVLRRRAKGWPIPPKALIRFGRHTGAGGVGGVPTSSAENDSLDHCEFIGERVRRINNDNATFDRFLYLGRESDCN